MPLPKDINDSPTEPKDRQYYSLADKELKIAVLKKFSEGQENTERQFSEIKINIYEQNELSV